MNLLLHTLNLTLPVEILISVLQVLRYSQTDPDAAPSCPEAQLG